MIVSVSDKWLYDAFLNQLRVEERSNKEGHYILVLGSIFLGKQYPPEKYNKMLNIFFEHVNNYLEDKKKTDPFFIKNFDREDFKKYFYSKLEEAK